MPIVARPYRGEVDLPLLTPFIQQMPTMSRHCIDLPYRLSSPTMQTGLDARLWQLEDGTVVGFVAWQYYWAVLDYFALPGVYQHDVEKEIFAWAKTRFRELDRERGKPLPYWTEFREDDRERQAVIEAIGFHIDKDDYYYVQFHHALANPLPQVVIPDGFTIRPLAGESEVEAYAALHRAAFESTSMTGDWRARTLRTPQYQPELDLVAVTADGILAGFCIGWLNQGQQMGQVEPIGVHPDYHHQGLGRALLLELLHRFKAFHVHTVIVETNNDRLAALQSYQSVGFQLTYKVFLKGLRASNDGEQQS